MTREKATIRCETCRKAMGFAEEKESLLPCCYCSEKCFREPEVSQARLEREDAEARARDDEGLREALAVAKKTNRKKKAR